MGGDGGSIPRRVELVRNKREQEKAEKSALNAARWKHCALSEQPLRQPIVACKLGRLYNKEAIIEKLLDSTKFSSKAADHIKRLKDVRELKLTPDTSENQSPAGTIPSAEGKSEKFCCPIMNIEMNGSYPFVFSWVCGCVVSKRAFDAVKDSACLLCSKKYEPKDIILLNPESEEDQMIAMYRLRTSKESNKKPTSSKIQIKTSDSVAGEKRTAESSHPVPVKKEKKEDLSNHHNGSIQDDPNASSVYKSLFTTSKEALNQPKAHWVTFNPLYFR
uniref:Replication termination factor 2 n=1 Tax=Schistocephalus solidus TaxID=70667 RepID=A0A0X3Q048_SCHSO